MIRPILRRRDPRLHRPADPVAAVDEAARAIRAATMDAMPDSGLAAPQIGVTLRLAVVDAPEARGQAVRMANPAILQASGQLREQKEASPCLLRLPAAATRPRAATVRFPNARGVVEGRDVVGLRATTVQHRIDPLDGRLCFDRLGRPRRDRLLRKPAKGER